MRDGGAERRVNWCAAGCPCACMRLCISQPASRKESASRGPASQALWRHTVSDLHQMFRREGGWLWISLAMVFVWVTSVTAFYGTSLLLSYLQMEGQDGGCVAATAPPRPARAEGAAGLGLLQVFAHCCKRMPLTTHLMLPTCYILPARCWNSTLLTPKPHLHPPHA